MTNINHIADGVPMMDLEQMRGYLQYRNSMGFLWCSERRGLQVLNVLIA